MLVDDNKKSTDTQSRVISGVNPIPVRPKKFGQYGGDLVQSLCF